MDLRLELIDATNWRAAVEVRVGDDQLRFVADSQPVALVILAKCYVQPGGRRWEPLLVRTNAGDVVGVFALTHNNGSSELRNFAIDLAYQGRGIGTATVELIIGRLRATEPDCRELIISAHSDNNAAHSAYQAAGLTWNGETRESEPVWRMGINQTDDTA